MSVNITTRAAKGIALSIEEMDANLTNLRDAIEGAREGAFPDGEIVSGAGAATGLYLPVFVNGTKHKLKLFHDDVGAFTLASVSPAAVSTAGGETLTVTGSGFGAPTAALRDANGVLTAITPTNITATSFNATMPAVAAGTYSVVVTQNGVTLALNNAIAVAAPPQAGSVDYDPATDTLLAIDTLQYTVESDVYIGPNNNGHKLQYPKTGQIANIEGWSVNLDPTGGSPEYPIAVKQNYKTMANAITAGTWPVGTGDGQCGVEGLVFKLDANGNPVLPGDPGFEFWFRYERKWSPGFRWSAFYPDPVITPNTQRMFNYKEFLIYRERYGGSQGRFTSIAIEESGTEINGSSATGEIPGGHNGFPRAQFWCMVFEPDSASTTRPGSCRYAQTLNNQLRGVDKSPCALVDGQRHVIVYHFRNETFNGAGDGLVEMYVDGLPVIQCDGLDASNPLTYKRVWSRTRPWLTAQHGPIVNGGACQDQTGWIIGPYIAYQKPAA